MASLIGAYCQTTESSSNEGSIGGLFVLLFLAFIIYKAKSISSTSRSKKRKKSDSWSSINNLNSIFNPSFNSINNYSNNAAIPLENKYISKYNAKRGHNTLSIGNDYPVNWPELRQEVLERDGYICKNCGAKNSLHVHHIVPKSKGGGHHIDNLATLCSSCHAKIHPHMENMAKSKSYNLPDNEAIPYRNDSSAPPVFNANHNLSFCKECGAKLHEIDTKDLGDRTIKVFQCEFCGAVHNKSFLKKNSFKPKYNSVQKSKYNANDPAYCRNCGNELFLSDTEKFGDLMIKSFECPACKSIYKKRYRKKTTL